MNHYHKHLTTRSHSRIAMLQRWSSVTCLLFAIAPFVSAQSSSPLRFVPSQAEVVVQVDRPSEVVAAVEKNELFHKARQLAGIREFYDSTNFQRFYQLIAYFEEKLGKNRNELVADLTGGGIVFAAKFSEPQGAMLVIQSKNKKALAQFAEIALELVEKELERQDSKDRVVRTKYQGHDVIKIGPKLNLALADGALVVASDDTVLKLALETHGKKGPESVLQVSNFALARKTAPAQALAWTWFHLEQIRKIEKYKNGLDASSLDPLQTLLFGGLVDLQKRSPYFTAALTRNGNGYHLGLSMPRGREGMAA